MTRRVTYLLGAVSAIAAITAPTAFDMPPRWVWNATASAPEGLYWLQPARRLRVGDWVAVTPPAPLALWLDRRGHLPAGVPLVKRVAALSPSLVCREGDAVRVDGRLIATARPRDRSGRPLPAWRGCVALTPAAVFLLNPAPDSLDGRYFGTLPMSSVRGRLAPVLTFEATADV